MLFNTTCQIIEPREQDSQSDHMQRDHHEVTHSKQRCSLRQTTRSRESTNLGHMALNSFTCRLQTDLPVSAGWQIKAQQDGDDSWHTYEVQRAGDIGFYKLLSLERI